MHIVYGILVTIAFCFDHYNVFTRVAKTNNNLDTKQSSYILSIKSTLLMFLIGLYFNYKFVMAGCDPNAYISELSQSEMYLQQLSILYFFSYLLSDVSIGSVYYHKHLTSLTGYFHHIMYMILSIICISNDTRCAILVLYMIAELPSYILGLGTFDNTYRQDTLFGITFFLTRIAYFMFLIYTFWHMKLESYLALVILPLHVYWFTGWVQKYGSKICTHAKTT